MLNSPFSRFVPKEETSKSQGMLPVARSTFEALVFPNQNINGWSLPGHGEPRLDCGHKLVLGCLEAHNQQNLDRDVVGKAYIKIVKKSCLRAVCPICYEKWASKEAHKIEYRVIQWHGSGRPIHVMLSIPESLFDRPMEELRIIGYRIARSVGIFGGSCIPHPFRERCSVCGAHKDTVTERCEKCGSDTFQWILSPHFHIIGYGWIRGDKVRDVFKKEGWITKNLGVRESVSSTAFYQLSHAGVKEGLHTVTWFGRLSYNKLKVEPEPEKKDTCPLCGADLVRIRWASLDSSIDFEEGEFFDDPKNWEPVFMFKGY